MTRVKIINAGVKKSMCDNSVGLDFLAIYVHLLLRKRVILWGPVVAMSCYHRDKKYVTIDFIVIIATIFKNIRRSPIWDIKKDLPDLVHYRDI